MFDLLFVTSIVGACVQLFKEGASKKIPAEYWANEELYYQDMMNDVPIKQRMKNLENGKYRLAKEEKIVSYPEPHKDPVTGQIIIENYTLYREDVDKYGAYKAMQWVKQGKYNLV